ncbi:hypothetical protein [Caballeronia sordidicola]|uniref:hypothetical protein n=1 Tax=Caballeronia sordidicola TaxID=196367 RepID=UPI0004D03A79|nr:hypothetical protein [Caballeronia sordidicola]
MDNRIAQLKTSQDARQIAENAQRLGRPDLSAQALERARELRAIEEGYTSPAQQAVAIALYAYEEEQSRLNNRAYRANRTRTMLAKHGALAAAERMVLNRHPSEGFKVLQGAGLRELSFEAIIDRFPNEFSAAAVDAARARLKGGPRVDPATPTNSSPSLSVIESDNAILAPAVLDAEARIFLEGFLAPLNWLQSRWLPGYRETTQTIAKDLSDDRPQDLFVTLWKEANSAIAHAGRGLLRARIADEMREEFIQVIRDIHEDGSPANFERITERFERWKSEGRIDMVPRLLVARVFAGTHPRLYHTTVDASSQDKALKWFAEHTNFVIPDSKSWAVRAQALVAHLDRLALFGEDILVRNMFPWFVVHQLRTRARPDDIPPGHLERPSSAFANLPPAQRTIALRHNVVQTALFARLAAQYGKDRVWTEYPTGTGGYADADVRPADSGCHLYEIKIADTPAEVVRQAMGQLLEYGFRAGGLEPVKLFAVGEPSLDDVTRRFIARLRAEFNLNIDYLQVELPANIAFSL